MKILINIFIILLLTAAVPSIKAQNDSTFNKNNIAKNAIYIEALGNGFNDEKTVTWGTLNYERNIFHSKDIYCAIRMGFAYNFETGLNSYGAIIKIYHYYSLPLMFNIISNPNGDHHIEAGFGVVVTNDAMVEIKKYEIGYTWNLKYRYQKKTKGIYFSAGWTPSVYFDPYYNNGPWSNHFIFDVIPHFLMIGMSIGYHF